MGKSPFLLASIMLLNFYSVAKHNIYSGFTVNQEVGDPFSEEEYLKQENRLQNEPADSQDLSTTAKPEIIKFIEQSTGFREQISQSEYSETGTPADEIDTLKNRSRKNAVYFTLAPDFVFWAVGGYFERIIYLWDNGSLFLRAGYQGWVILTAEGGDAIIFQPGILTGNQKNHFEAALGATYISTSENDNFIRPAISLGYRLQKPGKGFMFRTGIGYPDGIYVSIGTSF